MLESVNRVLILLTGFGGHEIVFVRHLEENNISLEAFVVTTKIEDVAKLEKIAGNRLRIVEVVIDENPYAKFSLFTWTKMMQLNKWSPDLLVAGSLTNYFTLAVFFLGIKRRKIYVPMVPSTDFRSRILKLLNIKGYTISAGIAEKLGKGFMVVENPARRSYRLSDRPSVAWIGRFVNEQKDVELAVQIAIDVVARRKDIDFNFYGDGPEYERLEKKVQSLDRVKFHGWVDNVGEIRPFNCLLNTSYYEGIPLTVIDSLEMGATVLIRDTAAQNFENLEAFELFANKNEAIEFLINF